MFALGAEARRGLLRILLILGLKAWEVDGGGEGPCSTWEVEIGSWGKAVSMLPL